MIIPILSFKMLCDHVYMCEKIERAIKCKEIKILTILLQSSFRLKALSQISFFVWCCYGHNTKRYNYICSFPLRTINRAYLFIYFYAYLYLLFCLLVVWFSLSHSMFSSHQLKDLYTHSSTYVKLHHCLRKTKKISLISFFVCGVHDVDVSYKSAVFELHFSIFVISETLSHLIIPLNLQMK